MNTQENMLDIMVHVMRTKIRFPMPNGSGSITMEDLWLFSTTDLRQILRDISRKMRDISDDEFDVADDLTAKEKAELAMLSNQKSVVEYVFNTLKDDAKRKAARAERDKKRRELVAHLAEKQRESTKNLTEEQLLAEIEKLDAEDDVV